MDRGQSSFTHSISPRFSDRWLCTGRSYFARSRDSAYIKSSVHDGMKRGVRIGFVCEKRSRDCTTQRSVSRIA